MEIIEKRFNIQVTEAGQRVSEKFELAKNAKLITGIRLTSDREDLLFYRGTQAIEINGKQCYEEDYESRNFQSSINVDVNHRHKERCIEPGNGIVAMTYIDNAHPLYNFSPYRVSLYVHYQI